MRDERRTVFLDTPIAVALFRRDQAVVNRFATIQSAISATVLGELYYGALKSMFTGREMEYVAKLVSVSKVFVCDRITALEYADIRNRLRQLGTPIPENDMWIAACARQHGLPIATRDGHYDRVPGFIVERW